MTTTIFDLRSLSRGLSRIETLVELERLVFILLEFETRMLMKEWDNFFTSELTSSLCPGLRER